MRSVPFAPLEPALYREAVRRALAEDLGWGDVTTEATVDPLLRARGVILAKCDCVIAGLDVAAEAFSQLDPAVDVHQAAWRMGNVARRARPSRSSADRPPRC